MYNDNRLLANETIVSDILTFSSFLEDIDIQNREYIPCPHKSLAKSSWYFFFFSLYVYIEWYRNEIFSFRRKSRRTFCSYFLFFRFSFTLLFLPLSLPLAHPRPSPLQLFFNTFIRIFYIFHLLRYSRPVRPFPLSSSNSFNSCNARYTTFYYYYYFYYFFFFRVLLRTILLLSDSPQEVKKRTDTLCFTVFL